MQMLTKRIEMRNIVMQCFPINVNIYKLIKRMFVCDLCSYKSDIF